MNIQVKKTAALQNQPVLNDGVKDVFTGLPGTMVTTDSTLSFHPTLDPSPQIRRREERERGGRGAGCFQSTLLIQSKKQPMKQAACHPDIGLTCPTHPAWGIQVVSA